MKFENYKDLLQNIPIRIENNENVILMKFC